jgi:ATP-dependent protease ClpP protease subunit
MTAPRQARLEIYDALGPAWAGMINARGVADQLAAAGELDQIEVRINSPGGSADEGLAIASILRDHPAQISVVVDGLAASAASLIAVAGDSVRIPKNALFMIHDPATFAFGGEREMQQALNQLKAYKRASIALYAAKSGKSEQELADLMSAETYFTGEEAVAAGFADTTGEDLPAEKAPTKSQVEQSRGRFARSQVDLLLRPILLSLHQEPAMAAETKPETKPEAKPEAKPAEPVLTKADVELAAKTAAAAASKEAIETERKRASELQALCQMAGMPEKAADYIAKGTAVEAAQKEMFETLCKQRPSVDGGGSNPAPAADANAKYKAEFKANPHLAKELSEEEYVASRRIDDGLDKLAKPAPKKAA